MGTCCSCVRRRRRRSLSSRGGSRDRLLRDSTAPTLPRLDPGQARFNGHMIETRLGKIQEPVRSEVGDVSMSQDGVRIRLPILKKNCTLVVLPDDRNHRIWARLEYSDGKSYQSSQASSTLARLHDARAGYIDIIFPVEEHEIIVSGRLAWRTSAGVSSVKLEAGG